MGRFKSKQELVDDIVKERRLFDNLLSKIPDKHKQEVVTDGMSVKDFLAHRTEWGRMMISWYDDAKNGGSPAVPSEKFKWNQLKELNADIYKRFKNAPLDEVEKNFKITHDKLFNLIDQMTEKELLTTKYYDFTGTSDLATYVNSATASHYRSARKHIHKWWKLQI